MDEAEIVSHAISKWFRSITKLSGLKRSATSHFLAYSTLDRFRAVVKFAIR